MRITHALPGDKRTERRFLWIPTSVAGTGGRESRWLEWATVEYTRYKFGWHGHVIAAAAAGQAGETKP